MKWFEIPLVVTSVLGFCLLCRVEVPTARADFTFGPPVNLGPAINSEGADGPTPSADGLELYLTRYRHNGKNYLGAQIYVARRATPDDEWGVPAILGPAINASTWSWLPSLSANGLSLYLTRGSGLSGRLYVAKRATTHDEWDSSLFLAAIGYPYTAYSACISADELELYFQSGGDRPGGYGEWDLWVATRTSVNDDWGAPVNLGPTINTPVSESNPGISPDGLSLFFSSDRTGGAGDWDIYVTRRATKKDSWGPPMNLGPTVNGGFYDASPKISFDGSLLYFSSDRPGCHAPSYAWDAWQAPILPVVDFDGDGKVDEKDLVVMTQHWGEDYPRCDVGPFAWGDGVVDAQDWVVLMEAIGGSGSILNPEPQAVEVPRDTILSWTSAPFAQSYDVYFGTSQAAINSASRANPQGVLVCQGQTAPLYKPTGLLEYNRIYHWRIDFVTSSPTPTIYQGPVLSFTTETFAYPIQNVTARASSVQGTMGPDKTVDGSGLDQNDGHSAEGKDMWLSTGVLPNWIQYEFDKVYNLHELWVWNSNQAVEPFIGFGARTVKIEYSTDGTKWMPLEGVPEFKQATGKAGYTHNTTVNFDGVPAKFVKLTIKKNWGGAPQTGLSEVRFFAIQSAAAAKP